jgi:hypothetical protein
MPLLQRLLLVGNTHEVEIDVLLGPVGAQSDIIAVPLGAGKMHQAAFDEEGRESLFNLVSEVLKRFAQYLRDLLLRLAPGGALLPLCDNCSKGGLQRDLAAGCAVQPVR